MPITELAGANAARTSGACNAIAQDRLRLETLAVIVEKLEIRRNRAIAHLDRVLINKPTEVWLTQPLDSRELLEILNELKRIIDRYYGFLGFDLLSIDNLHYYMNEDFEFLTKIIADANSAKLG